MHLFSLVYNKNKQLFKIRLPRFYYAGKPLLCNVVNKFH